MRDLNTDPLSRRQFLARTGSTVAGIALAGAAGAEDKPKLILGSGSQKYECLHDWLVPPDDIKWGDTHGVAQDSKGNIYIAHTVHPSSTKKDAVVVFDKNGKFLTSWGSAFAGGAHGLDLRKEGREEFLYHCDTNRQCVVKTRLDGTVVWEKGTPKEPGVYNDKARFVPTNIAFAPNGDFYVGDGYGSNYIHQYDVKGNWIRTFGGTGKDPGQTSCPHGLWVDTRSKEPMLVVADRGNSRMQYFSLDGKHIKFVTEGMRMPCHFHQRGDMLLIPDLRSIVTVVDGDNKVIAHIGDGEPSGLRDKPRDQFVPGKFIHPHGGKFLHNGDILIAEWVPIGRITLLKKVA